MRPIHSINRSIVDAVAGSVEEHRAALWIVARQVATRHPSVTVTKLELELKRQAHRDVGHHQYLIIPRLDQCRDPFFGMSPVGCGKTAAGGD